MTSRYGSARHSAEDGYFVEFRSRHGGLLEHTIVIYGRLDARGHARVVHRAGIYPADNLPGLIIGVVLPVDASVRAVADDFRKGPSNIYWRRLSAGEYARLDAMIRYLRAKRHEWHLLFYNCNAFAAEVAGGLGLATPSTWMLPRDFIAALRALNEP